MQEESCNTLCKTFARGLPGTGRISMKPHLGLKKAPGLVLASPASCLCASRAGAGVWRVVQALLPCVEWTASCIRLVSVTLGQEGATEKSCP